MPAREYPAAVKNRYFPRAASCRAEEPPAAGQ